MNLVDYVILAVIALCVIAGMYKGLLSSLLSTIAMFASWFGAVRLYPQLSSAIQANNWLMGVVGYYVDAATHLDTPGLVREAVAGVSPDQLRAIVSEANLPAQFNELLQNNIMGRVFADQGMTQVGEYINQTVLVVAINILSFILMFVVSYLVVTMVINLLNSVFHFPVLRHLDWLAGGVLGGARGYFLVFLLFTMIPLLLTVLPLDLVNDLIDTSTLGKHFMQSNFINQLIGQ